MAKQTFTTGQVLTAAQMTNLQQTAMLCGAANARVASYVLVAGDAGNCVSMSNASATTITVDTGIFAAGDTVTILNIGAGTCTITAGTATVSKPTNASLALVSNAGGVLYFTATGTAIFMPFDVGTGAAATGLTFITRNSFSNVAGVNIDSIFSSSYFNYLVIIEKISAATVTDDIQLQMRYGSTTTSTGYQGANATFPFTGTFTPTSIQTGTTTAFTLASGGDVTYPLYAALTFTKVGNTSEVPYWSGTGYMGNAAESLMIAGQTTSQQTYTGIRLQSKSTNVTGVVSVYGYAKA